jgi:rod shape-determining protein MreC
MDSNGLVGQVDEVLVHSASVILLSDPDHALPIEVERSRLRTIAYGSGREGELRLTDLPMNADIQVGDVLLSSGLGGRFQPGLPVADVTEVSRLPGEAFATATALLRARMQGARPLLVIPRASTEGPPANPEEVLDAVPADASGPAPVEQGDVPGDRT